IRAALTPRSLRPWREAERTSMRLPEPASATRTTTSSVKPIQKLCSLASMRRVVGSASTIVYDAPAAIPEMVSFAMVFVTWGAIIWLPDIHRWAEIVCHFLKPGGSLYLAEQHPAAMVFDDTAMLPDGRPGYFAPYFSGEAMVM